MNEHDEGLARDLDALGRRRVLLGGAGLAATTLLAAWGSDFGYAGLFGGTAAPVAAVPASGVGPAGVCYESAEETEGPYPADGSNTAGGQVADILGAAGLRRSDLRASFGGATGVAVGVPVRLKLRLVHVNGACAPLAGHAVYVWHCDREGLYSIYDLPARNYLRGVQETDANGEVEFTTIFPGCYLGRMPHIHVEVYRSGAAATSFRNKLKTTQIALPAEVCGAVYATAGYAKSAANLAQISFATDAVFADGTATEMATVTGNATGGYTVALPLGIQA
jgi:protocatechuate 3,4-dioxygenase beta subunit